MASRYRRRCCGSGISGHFGRGLWLDCGEVSAATYARAAPPVFQCLFLLAIAATRFHCRSNLPPVSGVGGPRAVLGFFILNG
jgi:hypothetical protein